VKKDQLEIQEVPIPRKPRANEVVVKMKAVGICGSDVHYWTHGAIGDFVVRAPMIIGHESAGQVVAVGSGVTHLKVGDKVALEPGVPCRACGHCRGGRYNLCPDIQFFATPPVHGSLATYVVHAADCAYKLPDNVSYEEGAMCEPLSVGVYSCQRTNVEPGFRIAILGAGPIGLIIMLAARAFGAEHVVMTDVDESRLKSAKKFGANAVINVKGKQPKDVAAEITKLTGRKVDTTFECCGMTSATQTAIYATKSGGAVCLVGLHDPEMKLPIFDASVREVDMRGIFRYKNTYPTCISLIASGRVNVKQLITHRYDFEKLITGFETAKTGRDNAIKVMFNL